MEPPAAGIHAHGGNPRDSRSRGGLLARIALRVFVLGVVLGVACGDPAPQVATENAGSTTPASDPRMAGFKGKIARTYEESVADWPKRPTAPADAPNVLLIL